MGLHICLRVYNMCICLYIYSSVCMSLWLYFCVCTYPSVQVYLSESMYPSVLIRVIRVYIQVYVSKCTYSSVRIQMYVNDCAYPSVRIQMYVTDCTYPSVRIWMCTLFTHVIRLAQHVEREHWLNSFWWLSMRPAYRGLSRRHSWPLTFSDPPPHPQQVLLTPQPPPTPPPH